MAAGAATFLATSTSANLAALLTDETGTGANVFATSPTFQTGVTINGSALVLNQTGATTAVAYSQWQNTGAQLIFGVDSSTGGGLGSGTSAYSAVFGTQNSTSLQFTTANVVRTTLDSQGNFGIGVTPSHWLDIAAGTTAKAPVRFASGTLMTTAAAGTHEYDGVCHYETSVASSRQVAVTEQFQRLTTAYTLTSQTAAQKLFNSTANGALTVAASTTYDFECKFSISAMSASSGSFGFAFGGTATLTAQSWWAQAIKAALVTAGTLQSTYNTAANVTLVTANTTTTGYAIITGSIRVSGAGTLIPQVSLGVAAAAIVGADSYFRIWPKGSSSVTNVGNWS